MGKNQQIIKLFIVLLLCTSFIFSFSHFGAKAVEKITNTDGKYAAGTTIGSLDVSGKTVDETMSLLEEKYGEWMKDTFIELQYGEKTVPFDLNQFHLDTKQTVDSIKDSKRNPAFIDIKKIQLEEQLETLFPQMKSSDIDLDKLMNSLNEIASRFEAGSNSLNLYNDYLLADHINKDAVINTAVVEMTDVSVDFQAVIEKNPTIEIPEESTFSLLEFAKKKKIEKADLLNVIATGIYQAVLPSNFSIVERNIGSSLPNYANLGFEAKVNPSNNTDFIIKNPSMTKYILELNLDGSKLKITLKGEEPLYNYKISLKDEQKLKPKTILQYSPFLLPGNTEIRTIGTEGLIVKVYRDVYQGEQFLKSEFISEDYYPPVYQVDLQGLAGSKENTTQAHGTGGNQAGSTNNNQTTDNSNQTTSQSNTGKENDSDLWGKPNEQPK